jgi:hypothetical protein
MRQIASIDSQNDLQINFEGWFQCRMATDPDPPDEPRGISGASFATVGEPDLDRVIRFHPPTDPRMVRTHGPQIGVSVRTLTVGEHLAAMHPLAGARVDLLSDPRFQEQNGVVAARNSAFIDPFDLQIGGPGGALLRRRAFWDPERPNLSFYDVEETLLKQRQVKKFEFDQPDVLAKVVESSGFNDEEMVGSGDKKKEKFIQNRLNLLRHDLREENPVKRMALEQRIRVLERTDWQGKKLRLLLAAKVSYQFILNGEAMVLGVDCVDVTAPWPISFWMGAWDNDALCGYVKGTLKIPRAVSA